MWSKCHHVSHQDRHKSQYQSKWLWVEFPIYLISLKYYSEHSPLYRMVLGEAEQSKSQFISDNFSTWRKYITVIISGIAYCLLKINFILPFCPIQELSKVLVLQKGDWRGIQNVPICIFFGAIIANVWSALTWIRNSWSFSQQNGKHRWCIIIELRSFTAAQNDWLDII